MKSFVGYLHSGAKKDYSHILNERSITVEKDLESIVAGICGRDFRKYSLLTALSGFDTINAINTRKALTEKSSLPKAFREKNIW